MDTLNYMIRRYEDLQKNQRNGGYLTISAATSDNRENPLRFCGSGVNRPTKTNSNKSKEKLMFTQFGKKNNIHTINQIN